MWLTFNFGISSYLIDSHVRHCNSIYSLQYLTIYRCMYVIMLNIPTLLFLLEIKKCSTSLWNEITLAYWNYRSRNMFLWENLLIHFLKFIYYLYYTNIIFRYNIYKQIHTLNRRGLQPTLLFWIISNLFTYNIFAFIRMCHRRLLLWKAGPAVHVRPCCNID